MAPDKRQRQAEAQGCKLLTTLERLKQIDRWRESENAREEARRYELDEIELNPMDSNGFYWSPSCADAVCGKPAIQTAKLS